MTSSTQSIQSHHQMWPGCSKDSTENLTCPADVRASSCPSEKESSVPQWTSWQISGGIYQPASKWRPALPWVWQQATRQTRSPTFFYHWDGAVGGKRKKKKQVGHILSVFSCLNACRLQTDGCRVASASKKKRGRGCRSQRVLSEMCQQTLAWPGLHSDSPLTVSSTTISPWRRQSQVTVYNIWKKTEDVHSGSNYWIKTSTKLILCKLVKYVSPSNVLFPVCHRISRWRWELHDQWCCVWEYSTQWNIDWGVTHVTFLPVDVPIVTGVQYLPRWPISVQKSIVPLSRFSICST